MSMFRQLSTIGLSFLTVCVAFSQTNPVASFEVASVKTGSDPNVYVGVGKSVQRAEPGRRIGCFGGPGTTDPGQWVCNSASLVTLITTAFKLQRYQFTPPDWMRTATFDIVAKIPRGSTAEQLRLMEQDLLATRFKLAVHFDEKEMPGYDLVIGKDGPKFKESADDPPDYTPPPTPRTMDWDRKEGYPILPPGNETVLWMLNGRVSNRWRKATMEELATYFAEQLQRPVDDATKLAAKYDVTLKFVQFPSPLPGTPIERDANGEILPQVVSSHPTFQEAVKSQLGLKLESKKATAKIMVIDHVEKVPVEN